MSRFDRWRVFPILPLVILALTGIPACGGGGGGGGVPDVPDLGFRVLSMDPMNGALSVSLTSDVTATFSEQLMVSSVGQETMLVEERATGHRVDGTVGLASANRALKFTPASPWLKGTGYRVRIQKSLLSFSSRTLSDDYVATFTTTVGDQPPLPPPDPQPTGQFSPVGDMGTGRSSHVAVLLGNGEVLVAGGFDTSTSVTTSAEIFNGGTKKFTAVSGGMIYSRGYHAAALLRDGRVLVTGGVSTGTLGETDTVEIYDPVSGSFKTIGTKMIDRRAFHTMTVLNDGRVLIAGGTVPGAGGAFSSKKAEIYDPTTNSFSALPDMAVYRAGHAATVLANGKVLLTGGNSTDRVAEIFDPTTDTFTSVLGKMITARRNHTADLLPDGTVLLMGGGERSAEIYVTSGDFFRQATGYPTVERNYHTSNVLPSGRIFYTGGSYWVGDVLFFNRSTEFYDPTTGEFSVGPLLSEPTTRHRGTTLRNGTVLFTGGSNIDPNQAELKGAEIYEEK